MRSRFWARAAVKRRGAVIASCAVIAGSAAVAAGCGDSSSSSTTGTTGSGGAKKIALLLPQNQVPRFEQFDKPFFEQDVKRDCPNCTVLYYNAGTPDAAKQQQQAEAALAEGADVLVVDPVDGKAAKVIVDLAKAQGVPVVAHDALIDSPDVAAHATFDATAVGEDQGAALARELAAIGKPRGPVLMLNGAPNNSGAALLRDGAKRKLDAAGVQILASSDTPNWDPAEAQSQMDQWITKFGPNAFSGILAVSDGVAAGAIASLRAAGIDPSRYPITGLDPDVAAIQRVISGDQLMTMYKPLDRLESVSADMAVRLAHGQQPTAGGKACPALSSSTCVPGVPTVVIPIYPVTKDNVRDTVVRAGYFTIPQICTRTYAAACRAAGLT